MADLNRVGDLEVRIVGTDGVTQAEVVTDEDTEKALKVRGNVIIAGSSGASQFLSIANKLETNLFTSTGGWDRVLDLTVPAGYKWFIKGIVCGTGRTAQFRLYINSVLKMQGHLDADDSLDVPLYGYEVGESIDVDLDMNCGAANQDMSANMIIFEEAIS